MKQQVINLLKKGNLKITAKRITILNLLLNSKKKAYSSSELIKSLNNQMNKSTIYRFIQLLIKRDIIQKMIDKNGDSIYSFTIDSTFKYNPHPHLKCDNCGNLHCLPNFPTNYIKTLTNLGVDKLNIVFGGICNNCTSSK